MKSTPPSHDTEDPVIVLLVDDQPFVAEVLRRFFSDEPQLMFFYCENPAEAVAMANQVQPTVILQDLVMPGVDGLSLVGRYRANPSTKDTPIIVFSTKEEAQTKSLAFSVGANDYLVKLPDRLELIARVRYHSRACLNQRQRDQALRALRESQEQLLESNASLLVVNQKLGEALSKVRQLSGLLPMCSYCKRVRDDRNYWSQIELYLSENSDLQLSHGVCGDCYEKQAMDMGFTPDQAAASAARHRERTGLTIVGPDTAG
jgi:PleD family two-component response regulator